MEASLGSPPAVNPEAPQHSPGHRCPDVVPELSGAGTNGGERIVFYVLKALPEIIFHTYVHSYLCIYFELELYINLVRKCLLFYDGQNYWQLQIPLTRTMTQEFINTYLNVICLIG